MLRTGLLSAADAGEEERFERERELLTRIKHPAIVDVYDWGHGEDFRYIVTEYFPSGSLELRIRNLMTARDSVDIFLQIAGALTVVHTAGLCHRDLKPANVMMRPDGRIVLIDFGLAKRMDDAAQLTNAGEVRGSPYYISPEQAEGAPVDQRSDLYSLGVMFYEMLTGQRPFRGSFDRRDHPVASQRSDSRAARRAQPLPAPHRWPAGEESRGEISHAPPRRWRSWRR